MDDTKYGGGRLSVVDGTKHGGGCDPYVGAIKKNNKEPPKTMSVNIVFKGIKGILTWRRFYPSNPIKYI